MVYNSPVKSKTSSVDAVRLIRFAALLWIGYLIVLAVVNQSFGDPRRGSSETLYYILLGFVAVLCLGLAYWSWLQERLGRAFLPIIIGIITVLPMLATWEIILLFPRNPTLDAQGWVLRLLPFLLVGFLLVAWQYRWQYMLLIGILTRRRRNLYWKELPPPPTRGWRKPAVR